jgi:chorismate dehydratase
MDTPRISASSYSNTAPLVWSFLYGLQRGRVELIMDNAPARSAELLSRGRVDAALVPVFAYQLIEKVRLVPDVCVGAREKVRSVCLVTRGGDIADVRTVSLDTSSRTSAALTKILFREFLGREPEWRDASPNIDSMLAVSDGALLIGDPTLELSLDENYRLFDLAELWRSFTGLGFIFAMWMTRHSHLSIDLAGARNEGFEHADDIAADYADRIGLSREAMKTYLTENITYSPDETMLEGMELYFALAAKHRLIPRNKELLFTNDQ